MGYNTKFKLEFSKVADDKQQVCAACGSVLAPTVTEQIWAYCFKYGHSVGDMIKAGRMNTKWYEYEAEMRALSSKFPDVLFTLHGDGEEAGDSWTKYFRGGKMHEAETVTTVAPFDPSKLR